MRVRRFFMKSFVGRDRRDESKTRYRGMEDIGNDLYEHVTTRRFLWPGKRKLDREAYERHYQMVPYGIKPADWRELNERLLQEGLISEADLLVLKV